MANLHLVCSSSGSGVNAPAVQCRLGTAYKQAIAFDSESPVPTSGNILHEEGCVTPLDAGRVINSGISDNAREKKYVNIRVFTLYLLFRKITIGISQRYDGKVIANFADIPHTVNFKNNL